MVLGRDGTTDAPAADPSPSSPSIAERSPSLPADVDAREPDIVTETFVSPPLDTQATAEDGAFEISVTANAAPVTGSQIVVYLRGARDPNTGTFDWRRAGSAVTDRSGIVRVFARSGRYMIGVRHAAYGPALVDATRSPADPITRVTVGLQAPVEIRGDTVRASDGAAVGFVDVTLRTTPWAPQDETVRARSDVAGRFVIKGLAPGNYGLEAYKEGEGRGRGSVNAPSEERVRLALRAPAFLSGRVRTASGAAAVGAQVIAVGGRAMPPSTIAGRDGAFVLEVDAGSYTLQATLGAETGSTNDVVRAIAGETVEGADITLAAAASIAGKIVDAANEMAIAGATIDVSPHGFNGDSGRAVSGSDGRFSVTPLSPGAFDVVVRAPGFVELERRGVLIGASERYDAVFTLQRPGSITGVVHDEAKQPIANALVFLTMRRNETETRTDASGRFVITNVTPAEYVTVWAKRDGESTEARATTAVKSGERAEVELEVPNAGTLEVEIVDAAGRVVKDGLLRVDVEGRGARIRKRLDGSALYTFSVQAGAYRARLEPSGDATLTSKSEAVRVTAGATTRVRLVGNAETSVALVTVLDTDGTPAQYARCMLRDVNDLRVRDWTISDAAGHCRLKLDPAKSAMVSAIFDHRSAAPVSAVDGVTLTLRASGSVRVTILGAVAGETAHVIIDADGDFAEREVASTSFTITNLAPDDDANVMVKTSSGRKGSEHVRIDSGKTNEVSVRVE